MYKSWVNIVNGWLSEWLIKFWKIYIQSNLIQPNQPNQPNQLNQLNQPFNQSTNSLALAATN